MKDAMQSTNEDISVDAPVPGNLLAGQRTVVQKVRERLGDFVAQATAAFALVLVFIFLSFASPVFLTENNLVNVVQQNAVTLTIALGMTFVIITAGIDLSVGSTAAMTGVLGVELVARGWHWPPAMLIAILAGGAIGLGNGLLISFAKLPPFIATLGMMTVVRGITDILTNAVVVFGPPSEMGPNNFGVIGLGSVAGIPVALVILVMLSTLAYFVLSRTRLGRYTYAIGSNQEARASLVFRSSRYLLAVYVILGLLTGLAGVIAVSRLGIGQPNFGIGLELDVIAATVIGGASLFGGQGTIVGTLIGVFLIGVIRDGSVLLDINYFYQNVIIGVVIWVAVFWDQFRRRFGVIGLGSVAGIPVALILLGILSTLAYFVLSRTRLGRYTYAIGSNQEAARLSGIPVKRYLLAVYVILGLLTGVAGVIAVSRLGIGQPNFGIGLELDVIAATVIGGASLFGGQGNIVGTIIGVFLIGLIRDGSVLLDINYFYQNVIIGIVIWVAVYWDQFRRQRITSLSS